MGEPTKKNPQSEGILADDSELGGGGIAALPDRVSRYGEAHRRALMMADYAIEHGDRPIAGKLKKCGDYLLFRHFFTVDKVKLAAASFCLKHLLCQLCAIRRGAKAMQAYMQRFETVLLEHPQIKAYMVTVTVKDGADLVERFNHLRAAMRRMTQARRDYLKAPDRRRHVEAAKALGGVHSIEGKRGKGSGLWHPTRTLYGCATRPQTRPSCPRSGTHGRVIATSWTCVQSARKGASRTASPRCSSTP